MDSFVCSVESYSHLKNEIWATRQLSGLKPVPYAFRGAAECVSQGYGMGCGCIHFCMIRKLKSGGYRLYSRKKDESTGRRRNLGTFSSMEKAKQHEREVQYFKKH